MLARLVCSLLVLAPLSSAVVQFSQSALYDIYDFNGVKEVPLPNCNNGCLIFASTNGDAEAYLRNVVVHDYTSGKDYSIFAISKQMNTANSQKLPYDLATKGRYSILNLNGPTPDNLLGDVSVYVVDRATAKAIDFEIYDAASMARATVAPKAVVTVMGARRFLVKADKGAANSFTARLAGFDNAKDNNADSCTYAYKTQAFDGFEFHVDGPIVSIVFNQKNAVALKANYDWLNVRDLSKAGFLASPGYHGCAKVQPLQVFRQLNRGFNGEDFDMHSTYKVRVNFDIDSTLSQGLVVKDMTNSKRNAVNGVQKNIQINMDPTEFVSAYYYDATPPTGFLARHTPTRV